MLAVTLRSWLRGVIVTVDGAASPCLSGWRTPRLFRFTTRGHADTRYNSCKERSFKWCRKGKGIWESSYPCDYTFFRLYLPWQWAHSSLQLWICAPDTHYGWKDQGSVEYKVCPTLLHMASTGNWAPDLLILSLTPYPLSHMLTTQFRKKIHMAQR